MKNFNIYAFADEADKEFNGQIKAIKRNNLKGLEIRGIGDRNIMDISIEEARKLKTILDDNSIEVFSIGSPVGKININDDFGEHFDNYKRLLEKAYVLGAKCFRLFSFFIPKEESPDIYKDEVLYRMLKFKEAANGSSIILCHENEKGIYGDTFERCKVILKGIPGIKAVFDPANFVQCGQNTIEAWDELENFVEYVHIKDSLKDGSIVPVGQGEGNLKYILSKYNGSAVTLEPHLYEFSGLKDLERKGETSKVGALRFKDANEAFDVASNALKNILKEIN